MGGREGERAGADSTNVENALIERARAAAHALFALPLDRKAEVRVNANHRGFLRVGEAKMADHVLERFDKVFAYRKG